MEEILDSVLSLNIKIETIDFDDIDLICDLNMSCNVMRPVICHFPCHFFIAYHEMVYPLFVLRCTVVVMIKLQPLTLFFKNPKSVPNYPPVV